MQDEVKDEAARAERKLVALLLVELDCDVEPEKLRQFIKKNWRLLAPLAHTIHAAPDYTKAPPGTPYNPYGEPSK